jgi:translocation and assembly module TamB
MKLTRQHLWWLSRIATGVGLGLTATLLGMTWGARSHLQQQLLPQVDAQLETALQRPVELGDIRFLLPWQITLGSSRIENLATARSVDVQLNVWRWLWQRDVAIAVSLNHPQIVVAETPERGWMPLAIRWPQPNPKTPIADVTVRLRHGTVTAIPRVGQPRTFEHVQSRTIVPVAQLQEQPTQFQVSALLDRAAVNVEGELTLPQRHVQVAVTGEQLPATLLPSILPQLPVFPQAGSADVDIALGWQPRQPLSLGGTVSVRNADLKIAQLSHPLTETNGILKLDDRSLTFVELKAQYGQIPFSADGTLSWPHAILLDDGDRPLDATWQMQGRVDRVTLPQLIKTFEVPLPFPVEGEVRGNGELTGPVNLPRLAGNFTQVTPAKVDRLPVASSTGQFDVQSGSVRFANVAAQLGEAGGIVRGDGEVRLGSVPRSLFNVRVRGADADAIATLYGNPPPHSLGYVNTQGRLRLVGAKPFVEAGWTTERGEITGKGTFQLRHDTATIPNAQLAMGNGTADLQLKLSPPSRKGGRPFVAQIRPQGVELGFLLPERNQNERATHLNGNLTVKGNTADMRLATLTMAGQVKLPQGIDDIPGAISAQVLWDGRGIDVERGRLFDALNVSGRIPVNPVTQEIGNLDLALSARNAPLARLPYFPPGLPARGLVDLQGQVSGTPNTLQLSGRIGLHHFEAAGLQFAPLTGPLQWQPNDRSITLDLRSDPSTTQVPPDQLTVRLAANGDPQELLLRQGTTEAEGTRQGNSFRVNLTQFPLALFNPLVPGGLSGTAESTVELDLATGNLIGKASASQASWLGIPAEQLQGEFAIREGVLSIANGQLTLDNSQYNVAGTVAMPQPNPKARVTGASMTEGLAAPLSLDLQVSTQNGSLATLRHILGWQDWADVGLGIQIPHLGPAQQLETAPIRIQSRSLFDQLEAFVAVNLQRSAQQLSLARSRWPALEQLRGDFRGQIDLSGPLTSPTVQFDLDGRNWSLDDFHLETVSTSGQYYKRELDISDFSARTGDRIGTFRGTLGSDRQQGNLEVKDFPIALLQRFAPDLPPFSGNLDATAAIGGTWQSPEAQGTIQLSKARLNGDSLQAVGGSFGYRQGQLQLDGSATIDGPPPVRVFGTIPLRLPFLPPDPTVSDRIALSVRAQDRGLKLINLLNDGVKWRSGRGGLNLDIVGTWAEPSLNGALALEDTALELNAFATPLQGVDAQVVFNSDRLQVQSFSGRFSEGVVSAKGLLPINPRGSLSADDPPMSMRLQQLDLDLPERYSGGAEGTVVVGGTLLSPQLSGELELSEGRIDVSPRRTAKRPSPVRLQWQPTFNALNLKLGSGVNVSRGPLFTFGATGDLQLFGSFENLQPEGTIQLESGRVNLGAATFTLDRSRPNTAVFSRERGLDPLLDVQVATQTSEIRRGSNETENSNAPLALGEQRTVRVLATIQGRASELAASGPTAGIVQLTSSPPRPPDEIVALLGTNAVNNLANGDLAGFALSTFLNTAQERVRSAMGLDELQIQPFLGESDQLSWGVEAAKDLGNKISISVQRSLTDEQPTRYNARYRFSDRWQFRMSSDFEGSDRATLEYETRF